MKSHKFLFWATLPVLWSAVGCATLPPEPQVFPSTEPVELAVNDRKLAMQVAEEVLRRMNFSIDKYDLEQGVILTDPLPGAQFFEFWRDDNASAHAFGEANLHSIRRQVRLQFFEPDGTLVADCDVQTSRLSIPEVEIEGMTQAPALYTRSRATLQQLQINAEQAEGMAWIDLGPDPALETAILQRIQSRLRQLEGLE